MAALLDNCVNGTSVMNPDVSGNPLQFSDQQNSLRRRLSFGGGLGEPVREPDYGLVNFAASIGTLTLTSLMVAENRPSSHRKEYLNGNLIPFTSR